MRTPVKWGIILGVAIVVWTLVIHALGFYTTNIAAGKTADVAASILPIAAIALAIREERRKTNSLTVLQGVKTGLIVAAVSAPITIGFLWIYHHYMNPQWVDYLVDYEQKTRAAKGETADQIQKAVDGLRRTGTDRMQIIGGIIGTVIMGAFVGLVAGILLRRRPSATSAAAALLIAAALFGNASVADAQRLTPSGVATMPQRQNIPAPSHPFIDRMNYWMNRGAIVGALGGLAYGVAVEESAPRGTLVLIDGLVGAGLGMTAGAVAGLLAPPRPYHARYTRYTGLAAHLDEASRYVGLGGKIGTGLGLIYGLATEGEVNLNTLFETLGGFTAGMAVGSVTYLARRRPLATQGIATR